MNGQGQESYFGLPLISKSKFLMGSQCRKLLWVAYNDKPRIPSSDAATQAIFDQGHEVGTLAKSLFPGGIEVGANPANFDGVIQSSLEAAKTRKPLFEAGFVHNDGFAPVDILNPVGKDAWDIIEVKSSTEIRSIYLLDLAFQVFVYTGAGLRIRRCCLMTVNSGYVRRGAVDPNGFFTVTDVTKEVSGLTEDIQPELVDMLAVIRQKKEPEIQIGPHCSEPYECPLQNTCWAFVPEHNVFDLYRGGKKCWRLFENGVVRLKEIPDGERLTERQEIQRTVALTGKPHIDRKALDKFLKRIKHPVSYLDFETFNTAVPLFDTVSPWQQVPFQFSLHRQTAPGATPEHFGFLADGQGDPRPAFLDRLQSTIGEHGSVIVYNEKFELGVLDALADAYPQHVFWIADLKKRVVDLLEPFQAFHYYHPDQHGSASIKTVLPVLTGKSYEHLEIHEGGQASLEYLRVQFHTASDVERKKVRRNLEQYCAQDTEGMTWIVDELRRLCQ